MKNKSICIWTMLVLLILTVWGCGSSRDSNGTTATANTPEASVRTISYVGADRCGVCHETTHDGWAASAHTKKLRDGSIEQNYANDGTASGRSDFFDGTELDLGTAANATAFAVYGTDAPILGSSGSQAYVKIGSVTYAINYTLGGGAHDDISNDANGDGLILNDEATWKQRYITKIGKSNYILPVQFNQQTQEYVVYHGSDWYETDNTPLVAVIKNQSYERRCAGCHVTGLEVALDGDEWVMEFSDISVSCEACHGPGGQHATVPSKENIINPATMTTDLDLNSDGVVDTIDQLIVRNYVCYACHTRGGGYTSDTAATTLGYPSKGDSDSSIKLYIPGLDWKEYYTVTESTGSYFGGTPATGFITSKQHHQQQLDLDNSPHGPDKVYDHECFVCHDMHSTANDGLVVSTIESDGLEINVDTSVSTTGATNNRNNLCLSCHAGHGDFAALDAYDVKTGSAKVDDVGKAHMAKRAAKSRWLGDTKSMFSCTGCHMPDTAKSAVYTTKDTGKVDANGDPIKETIAGDVSTHTFTIIWPSLSVSNPGLPNSCNGCHNGGGADDPFIAGVSSKDDGTVILRDWANSGHGDETAEAWKHYDWDEGDAATTPGSRQSCQRCHTATGAMNFLTDPVNYDQAANSFGLREGENQVLYCYGCHSDNMNGIDGDGFGTALYVPGAYTAEYASGAVTVAFADNAGSNVCIPCHAGRESGDSVAAKTADFINGRFVNSHYLSAAGVLFANTGYHYTGRDYDNTGHAHTTLGNGTTMIPAIDDNYADGPCVTCHFSSDDGSHTLSPLTNYAVDDLALNPVCINCHDTRGVGSDAGNTWLGQPDVDGNFVAGTYMARYQASLEALAIQLETAGHAYLGGYPYFATADWTAVGTVSGEDTMGAAFNFNLLLHEPAGVAHNRQYTRRLLYDSIDFLDDGTLNYSVLTTLNALAVTVDFTADEKADVINYLIDDDLAVGTAGERY